MSMWLFLLPVSAMVDLHPPPPPPPPVARGGARAWCEGSARPGISALYCELPQSAHLVRSRWLPSVRCGARRGGKARPALLESFCRGMRGSRGALDGTT
mmetsp:Transcript_63229/g.168121  ORF Transcript_63229/g.168121 Transcript_63229/m.168121 type:complete len:99 (-) Transcript_63229:70-366(-)